MKAEKREMDWTKAVREMPEGFTRRIMTTCETLPEQERRLPVRGIGLAAALCAIALLAVFLSVGMLGDTQDRITPLSSGASASEAERPGGTEQEADPLLVRDGYSREELLRLYAHAWPFVDSVLDEEGQIFREMVYLTQDGHDPLTQDGHDPYYHLDPEKCGAGEPTEMLKTVRQTAYRLYRRELCMECAPERDLGLRVWINEDGRVYHKEQECMGETMLIQTTLENAVQVYGIRELCVYCSGVRKSGDIEAASEQIISIDRRSLEITLNEEWAAREVCLADDGVYHYNGQCTDGPTESMSQLVAVRDRGAVPCAGCMGQYTGSLVVYYNEDEPQYHALSICGGRQLGVKAFQKNAIDEGKTICSECFREY